MISNDSPLELIALHGSLTVEYIIELMSIIFSNDCIQLTYGLVHHIPKQTRSWITSSGGNSLLDRDPNPETFSARLFLKKREKLPLCKNLCNLFTDIDFVVMIEKFILNMFCQLKISLMLPLVLGLFQAPRCTDADLALGVILFSIVAVNDFTNDFGQVQDFRCILFNFSI
ncbi:hypothetical protein BLOT_003285 [Blomia tropicalis]|nr:hypothetical protein BLOT_003285 [Blomia tropicalis]